jgi:probable DNA metabolism protein
MVKYIDTNEGWAARVLKGIDGRTNASASALTYKIFLSELPLSEMLVYQVVQAIIQHGDETILENFANPFILKAAQIEKMIHREVHRMHAFVRFQEAPGGLFCAAIDPDFNILPLIGAHFERRYADQAWVIFDVRRNYGLYYDQLNMSYVRPDDQIIAMNYNMFEANATQDVKEEEYQSLWKNYFHAVNINERNNPKLHLRHMPRRYWKYLIEKNSRPKND